MTINLAFCFYFLAVGVLTALMAWRFKSSAKRVSIWTCLASFCSAVLAFFLKI